MNGLTAWRERQMLERQWRLAMLEQYRRDATVEVREGREYRVLQIPDRYDFTRRTDGQVEPRRPLAR